MTSGILLLNKRSGPSSTGILGPLKRSLDTRKIGHTGTLDPFASGLLILMVGRATRLASLFTALDKTYEATLQLGAETDTLDPEGTIIDRAQPATNEALQDVLPRFRGTIEQIPPAYSAIHVSGRRAYELARRGETVTIPARNVRVDELSLEPIDTTTGRYRMTVACSSGTYIRSLARDVSRAAGSRGYLVALHRRSVGPFSVADAVTPDEFLESESPERFLWPIPEALRRLGTVRETSVPEDLREAILSGIPLSRPGMAHLRLELDRITQGGGAEAGNNTPGAPPVVLLVDKTGRELALCRYSDRGWRYAGVFS